MRPQLAAKSKGLYKAEQIEDAMRNSGNGKRGEKITTGMIIPANDEDARYDKGAQWQKGEDGKLVQVLPNGGNVAPDLAAFIAANTGGGNSAYSWYDYQLGKLSPAQPSTGTGGTKQRYEQYAANGKVYTLPIADCPAVSCTNDTPIARYGVSADDAATIAAYDAAKKKEMVKDAVTGGLIVATTVALPATAVGAAIGGAIVGGGSSAANQTIDEKPIDGAEVGTEAVKGAVIGLAGYGVVKGIGIADDVLSKTATKADDAAVALEAQAIAKARIDANSGRDAENYLPETWTRLKTQTDQLRTEIPDMVNSSGKPVGNAATAEINVYGQGSTTVQAHSQIGNDAASLREGFVSLPPEGQRILKPLEFPNDPIPRQVDTEYKILESFAQKNIGNTNVQGSINLFTERPPCSSCTNVIEKQFADLFPNMEVRVFHNNGEIAVYKGGVTNTVNMPAQNKAGWPTSPDLPSPLNK